MSQYINMASGGGGANQNLNNSYESLGFTTTFVGTACTAGNGSKGSASATLGTTAAAWSGFWLYIAWASTSNARYLVDVSKDGGSTWFVTNFYIEPSGSGDPASGYWFPLNVAASSDIRIRAQGVSGSGTVRAWVRGVLTNSQSPPAFNTFTALNADTTNTRPSGGDVTMVANGSTTFTELVASTGAQYGGLAAVLGGPSGGAVTTGQMVMLALATGAAASETVIARHAAGTNNASAASFRGQPGIYIEKTIAASTRLSVQVFSNTQGANDMAVVGLYGFS